MYLLKQAGALKLAESDFLIVKYTPALRVLSQKLVDVRPLISACYPLDEGLTAFEYATQKGVLKVLVQV